MKDQSFVARHLRLVIAAALTAPVAITLATSSGGPASAALAGVTPFEIDSNTTVQSGTDWLSKFATGDVAVSNDKNFTGSAVVQSDVGTSSTAPSWLANCPGSNQDSVFKNSTNINDPDWTGDHETQSVTPKDDICQSYFSSDVIQSGARAGHIISYIAFTRRVFNGDGSYYFLLSKGPNPDIRVAGDIVIEVDYGSQGQAQGLTIQNWTGAGTPTLSAPTAIAVNNPNVELTPVQYFAEMAIDLTALGLAPNVYDLPTPQSCLAFGFGRVISRTGNSASATLKDDGEPAGLDFNVCGKLIVKKQLTAAVPGSTDFPIDITAPSGVTLPYPHPVLRVPGGTTNGGTPVDGNANPTPNATPTGNPITYQVLPPRQSGGYNVWEPLAGDLGVRWDRDSIVCVNDKGTAALNDDVTTNIDDPSDVFSLFTLETVTCTITNSPAPAVINVDKNSFGLAGTWPVTLGGAGSGSVDVSDDGVRNFTTPGSFQTFGSRPAGAYTLTEGAAAANGAFRPSGWSCTVVGGATTTASGAAIGVSANPGDVINCTITNTPVAPPNVEVTKTAAPTSFPETATAAGSPIVYTVDVHNAGTEPFTITNLTDAVQGGSSFDLDAATVGSNAGLPGATIASNNCGALINQTVLAGATTSCQFSVAYSGRNANDVIHDTVNGFVVDSFGRTDSDDDDATVTVTDVPPVITVDKQNVEPITLVAPGGLATYSITITNGPNAIEPITLTAVTDTLTTTGPGFGSAVNINYFTVADPVTASTCINYVNTVLTPGQSVTCQFTIDTTKIGPLAQGETLTNRVDVTAVDNDGTQVTGFDTAGRPVLGEPPSVRVFKTDNGAQISEPGQNIPYVIRIENLGATEPLFITSITDEVTFIPEVGAPASRGTLVIDGSGVHTDNLDVALVSTDCGAKIGTELATSDGAAGGADETSCTITLTLTGNAGDAYHDVVTVTGEDDEGEPAPPAQNEADTPVVDVLPSITIDKVANTHSVPETGGPVSYTLTITNTSVSSDPLTITSLSDNRFGTFVPSAADVPNTNCDDLDGAVLAPGASVTCTITANLAGQAGTHHDNTASVTGVDDEGNPASDTDDESVNFTDVLPQIVVTKTGNPTAVPESGGLVTFTVTVQNTTLEPVVTSSLVDKVDGQPSSVNLVGLAGSTCVAGVTIQPGATYTCTFTRNVVQVGGAASEHDTVTVVAHDDEDNTATDDDDETVTFQLIPPTVTITKTDDDATVSVPGGDVTYSIDIHNTSFERVSVTTLTDTISYEVPDTDTVVDLLNPVAPVSAFECHNAGHPTIDIKTYSLAPDETVTCTFKVTLSGAAQIVRDVVNVVVVDNDNQTDDDNAPEATPILAPAISVDKTVTSATRDGAGLWTIGYQILVDNSGDGAARLDIRDTLHFGGAVQVQSAAAATATQGVTLNPAFNGASDTLIAANVDVAGHAAQTYTVTVTARIDAPVAGQGACDAEGTEAGGFLNTVTLDNVRTGDQVSDFACAPFSTLTLVKNLVNNSGGTGTLADFVLSASANGVNYVQGTGSVTAAVPAGTYALAETAKAGYASSGFSCSTGQTGASVDVPAASEVTCTVTNDDAPTADLAIIKSASIQQVGAGGGFTWLLDVTNNGPDPAVNVAIADVVPSQVTVTGVTSAEFNCANSGNTVSCTKSGMAVGEKGSISITVSVSTAAADGTVTNIGSVTSNTPDPNPANNSDDASVSIVAQAPPLPTPPPVVLPPTGSNSTAPAAWIAGSLVLLGGVILLVTRRRRHTSVN